MNSRKKQVRFTEKDDILLLREVVARNPFAKRAVWVAISENITIDCDSRRARERTMLLLSQHKKNNQEAQKLSGVAEVYGERETLMEEALELAEEEERSRTEQKEKSQKEEKNGKDMRKRAMENLTKCDEETPTKKSGRDNSTMGYLREKMETENKIKEQELEMRKHELQLQKERFQLEKQERMQKLENEKQQAKMMADLMKALINKN